MKSERQSPYFINFGALTDGEALAKIKWAFASYIALLLEERKLDDFDFVFGPAYKGINLATLTCEGLNELFGMEKRYLYDRKEIKNYGDVEVDKVIVGAQHFNSDQGILIVDDIITTGGTILETIEKIRLLGPSKIVGLVLAVDRQEKTGDAMKVEDKSAVDYVREQFNIKVFNILNIQTIFNLIKNNLSDEIRKVWTQYHEKYGVSIEEIKSSNIGD